MVEFPVLYFSSISQKFVDLFIFSFELLLLAFVLCASVGSLICSTIPLYRYLHVFPDTEHIWSAQLFRYIATCLWFLILCSAISLYRYLLVIPDTEIWDHLLCSAIPLYHYLLVFPDTELIFSASLFRYITACMFFLIHTHSSESRLSYSTISILFLLAFPYTQSRRAGHVTIFELRDNDNGIEYQGQEKIRKIVRPRCLNGVATPNIDIIQ